MSETLSGSVEIGEAVLYQQVGDEVVLLNMTTQEYFSLDRVGSDVWQLLMEHRDLAAVGKQLAATYSVDEQTALSDIHAMISEMTAANLLKITPYQEQSQPHLP